MGEIAELMLTGKLCNQCGVSIREDGYNLVDIPTLCHDCHSELQDSCEKASDHPDGGLMCENFYAGEY